tara:strand:- start:582 stop:1133 length:552 start_codon:yes stop_codon:yes gene_type:complete
MSYYVYKICCDDLPDFIYVGSTKSFRQRKGQHKRNCDNLTRNHLKLYQTIRDNGGWQNWRMVIIEECGEISLTQVRIKEEENRVKLNANLNSQRCYQTEEEKKEYKKEWCENNKEYKKECAKEYRENNKEHIKEYNKEYRENNKEKFTEKIKCECGVIYTYKHKTRHFKTKTHLKYIESLEKD